LLEIMDSIDSFCSRNHINYYLHGGSLIGAVRHQGFIPWDDDVDICMLRKDYERFIRLYGASNEQYDVLCCEDNRDYYIPQAKVCDRRTIIDEHIPGMKPSGVYVDVFPLDLCPGDYEHAVAFTNKMNLFRNILTVKNMAFSNKRSIGKNIELAILKTMAIPFSRRCLVRKINNSLSVYKDDDNIQYVAEAVLMPYGEREVYELSWFASKEKISFEDREYYVPSGYDSILKKCYGNYMKLPPENERPQPHGEAWWKE